MYHRHPMERHVDPQYWLPRREIKEYQSGQRRRRYQKPSARYSVARNTALRSLPSFGFTSISIQQSLSMMTREHILRLKKYTMVLCRICISIALKMTSVKYGHTCGIDGTHLSNGHYGRDRHPTQYRV